MTPWDFGIINAIAKELLKFSNSLSIFPSEPPKKQSKTPYIIFTLNKIIQTISGVCHADFSLAIAEDNETSYKSFDTARAITNIVREKLTLYQNNDFLGSIKIKIKSIENKKNTLILNLEGFLQLKQIYEDEIENDE